MPHPRVRSDRMCVGHEGAESGVQDEDIYRLGIRSIIRSARSSSPRSAPDAAFMVPGTHGVQFHEAVPPLGEFAAVETADRTVESLPAG